MNAKSLSHSSDLKPSMKEFAGKKLSVDPDWFIFDIARKEIYQIPTPVILLTWIRSAQKKTTNISIKHPLICLQLYSSSEWMECDFETVRPSKYWHCCFEETCSNMFRLLSDFPQKENICFSHLTANFSEWSPIQSVFIRTTANRGPICLSWVWLQIKLDGSKFFYQLTKNMTKIQIERHRL